MNNKNKKAAKIIGDSIKVMALIVITISIAACTEYVDVVVEVPGKPQSEKINFGDGLSVTLEGTFTDIAWPEVKADVLAALNKGSETWEFVYNNVFADLGDVYIILVDSNRFEKYHTTRGGGVMYINRALLYNADALEDAISTAARRMFGNPDLPDMAKVIPNQSHNTIKYT